MAREKFDIFKKGFVGGIGWSLGVTVGFFLISTVLVYLLGSLGGLPLVGEWIASLVKATQGALIAVDKVSS